MFKISLPVPNLPGFTTANTYYLCENPGLYNTDDIEEVLVKYKGGELINDFHFKWMNCWGFPYYLRAKSVIIEYFKYENTAFRKYDFEKLEYSIDDNEWKPLMSSWGNENVIKFEGDRCFSTCALNGSNKYEDFCAEIFADG